MSREFAQIGFLGTGQVDFKACEKRANEIAAGDRAKPPSRGTSQKTYVHDYEENVAPDCQHCLDNCCSSPHVTTLRLSDLVALKNAGFAWAIARPSPASEGEYPSLKQVDGRCVFLTPEDRCAIYPIRPLVCRAFPLQVDDEGRRIRYSSACQSRCKSMDHGQLESMADLAVESYEQKAQDKTALEHESDSLVESGILEFVRPVPARTKPSKTFETVLNEKLKT